MTPFEKGRARAASELSKRNIERAVRLETVEREHLELRARIKGVCERLQAHEANKEGAWGNREITINHDKMRNT